MRYHYDIGDYQEQELILLQMIMKNPEKMGSVHEMNHLLNP